MVHRRSEPIAQACDFEDIAENRSKAYWFLASFYLQKPEPTFLEQLGHALAAWDEASDGDLALGLTLVKKALSSCDSQKLAERLAPEYARCFLGIKKGHGQPPPYESVHRQGCLLGEATKAVVTKYAEAGFGAIDQTVGPQDHIGAELKFMSLLCLDEMRALQKSDIGTVACCRHRQRRFLDDHLLRWVPAYCRSIQKESGSDFYNGAAIVTEQAIAMDWDVLNGLLERFPAVSEQIGLRLPRLPHSLGG